jgi:hypothetical protein
LQRRAQQPLRGIIAITITGIITGTDDSRRSPMETARAGLKGPRK